MVDDAMPMNSWKLPVAETLPILNAFSMEFSVPLCANLVTFKCFWLFFVVCGCYGGVCG
jgi:hypothetical protein